MAKEPITKLMETYEQLDEAQKHLEELKEKYGEPIWNTAPTRQCLVCGCKENDYADIVNTDKAWLCNDCKDAVLKVRYRFDEIADRLERCENGT